MKFLASGGIKANRHIYAVVWLFLFLVFLYWAGGLVYFQVKFGFSTARIETFFFGDPEFPEPVSIPFLLEKLHANIFIFSMLFLTLTAIIFQSDYTAVKKVALSANLFLASCADLSSDFIVLFGGREVAFLETLFFLWFEASLLAALAAIALFLVKKDSGGQNGGEKRNSGQNGIWIFSLLNLTFVAVNAALFMKKIGFSIGDVKKYYAGSAEDFIQPKSLEGLVETANIHFIAMSIYLLTLAHFIAMTGFRRKSHFIAILFSSAFLKILSGFLVRYATVDFAWLKFASFLVLNVLIAASSVILIIFRESSCHGQGGETVASNHKL